MSKESTERQPTHNRTTAREQNADFIILDEWQARETALALSLRVIGTVAVLAKAREKGLISDLSSALQELREAGFYVRVN